MLDTLFLVLAVVVGIAGLARLFQRDVVTGLLLLILAFILYPGFAQIF